MKIGLFSVSHKHKKLFDGLGEALNIEFTFFRYEQKRFRVSWDIVRFFPKVKFSEAIAYSIKFFEARKSLTIPKQILYVYFALELFEKYLRYMLTLDPKKDYYIFWNGKKPRHLIAIQIVKLWGIEVRYMENGLLPNRLVFDAKGVNFENSVPRERVFFENYKARGLLPQTLIPRVAYHSDKFKDERITIPKEFIFVPFQVDYDSQILLYSPWIEDMRAFFNLIELLAKESDMHFIIKEHPSSRKDYDDLHKKSEAIENVSFVNGYSTQELIEKSSAVLTINSTVGIESLLLKKRVIVLGDACYAIEGISKRVSNFQALLEILENLENWKVEDSLRENFLNYLYFDYLIPMEDCSPKQFEKILFNRGS